MPSNLDGAWFVTAAATPEVNRAVREAAEARGVFVNAVDDPANATAYLGGTIKRGGVTVAFSTAGQAPALAGLLREAFDELVPPTSARGPSAQALSRAQRADGVPMAERRPQLLDALNRLYAGRHEGTIVSAGFVSLVGAGPGHPDHLTLKAARRLREADVVFYDALVSAEVCALATRALRINVGKRAGRAQTPQPEIERC